MLFILLPLLTVASHSSSCPDQERVSLQCVGKEPPSVPVSQALAQHLHPTPTAVNKPPLRLQFLLPCCRANCNGVMGDKRQQRAVFITLRQEQGDLRQLNVTCLIHFGHREPSCLLVQTIHYRWLLCMTYNSAMSPIFWLMYNTEIMA